MAGHKGYAIATVMDMLSGVLTGSLFGGAVGGRHETERRSGAGQMMIVLDIAAFQPPAEFGARMEQLIGELKSVPLAEGYDEILYPGELEARNGATNRRDGLLLPDDTLADLAKAGREMARHRKLGLNHRRALPKMKPMIVLARLALAPLLAVVLAGAVQAQTLKIADRQASKTVTAQQLLADPAMRTVTISNDSVYGRSMTYRALPAVELLKGLAIGPTTMSNSPPPTNSRSAFLPGCCFILPEHAPARPPGHRGGNGAVAGDPRPWQGNGRPVFPGVAGRQARRDQLRILGLQARLARGHRQPATSAGPHSTSPTTCHHPPRPARARPPTLTLCISCHRFNGAGEGEMGPDLAKPMNPVDYFQPEAFRKFLRSSKSVRDWPERKMPSFVEDVLSNEDMESAHRLADLQGTPAHP